MNSDKNKLAGAMIIIMIAYAIPMIACFAVSHELYVFLGAFTLVFNIFMLLLKYEDSRGNAEGVLINAKLVLVLGIIFSVIMVIGVTPYLALLMIAMLVVSLIFCGMF